MEHTKSDAEFKQRLIDDPESVLQEFGLPTDPEALLQLTPPVPSGGRGKILPATNIQSSRRRPGEGQRPQHAQGGRPSVGFLKPKLRDCSR
jgi:hypothetical protein